MVLHSARSSPLATQRLWRIVAPSLALLMLTTACATGELRGAMCHDHASPPLGPSPMEVAKQEAVEREFGEVVFAKLPTDFAPVRISDAELTAAMTTLWYSIPLRVATPRPTLYVGRRLALGGMPLKGPAWQSELLRSYGQFCEQRGAPGDCLTLFDDGPRIQADDKRSIALALAVLPALGGVDAEMRAMVNPTRVMATLSITITAYLALLVAPEPVTKGVAVAFSVLMWGYLGWEFFDLLRAYVQLHEDAPQASTFSELRDIGERFGRVIGPSSVRLLVMVATAAIGETASLVSKGPNLPGFNQASRAVEFKTGLRLSDMATRAESVVVSLNQGVIRTVLPVNAVSMTARDGGGERSARHSGDMRKEGELRLNGSRGFKSFGAFKRFMGKAGDGKEWHHIIEQRNVTRFGAEAVHNTENVIPLEKPIHDRVSALYSSVEENITRSTTLTVRQWLDGQSYEAQRAFGLLAIENVRKGLW